VKETIHMAKRKVVTPVVPRQMTNIEFITDMMTFSQHGAMAQLFIMDAVGKWAKKVAETPYEEVAKEFGPNYFISSKAWHETAKEIHEKMNNRR
jgi:hypothetical protein